MTQKLIYILLIILISIDLKAQLIETGKQNKASEIDTNYIVIFPKHITTRAYLSRKYTNMALEDKLNKVKLQYEPNTSVNFGIGATVNGFTLNLAYGFNFLNEDVGKGKTKYLDLQSHMYTRKYVIDFFGQFYNGQYLDNTQDLRPDKTTPYYLRPDFRFRVFGLSVLKVFNDKKFSYAAPLIQNEYQKKSAGSFLLGAEFSLIFANADSSFIPYFIDDSLFSEFQGIDYLATYQFGPSVGYTYSLVILKHVFATASLNLSLLIGETTYELGSDRDYQEWQFNPNFSARAAIGYNSENWYLGLQVVQNTTRIQSEKETIDGTFGIGNVRFNYVQRFLMGPKFKKQVDRLPF